MAPQGGFGLSWDWHPAGALLDDFYLDVEPGTRILKTRNLNAVNPNIAVTGIHTGTGYFENFVGIGTTSPGSELELWGNFTARHKGANVANTNISAINFMPNGAPYNNPVVAIRASFTGANWYSGSKLSFFTNPGPDITVTESVERLTIDANGYTGIGTTTPGSESLYR